MNLSPEPWVRNSYTCPSCGTSWDDEWDCEVEDDCPECGERHITPVKSEDLAPELRQVED